MNGVPALRSAALLAGLPLLLTGCGDRPGYDASEVESYLVASQAATFAPSGRVTHASCPDGLKLREGMSLTCKLTVSGAQVPYRVRLTHVRSTRVSVAASPDGVLLSGARLSDLVRTRLPRNAASADVDCGGAYVAATVGKPMSCTLRLGSQERPIKVTVTDPSGTVEVRS